MKPEKYNRCAYIFSTLLFGVAVLLFFALAYPHHLHFQEQYQLFLFNKSYVCDVLSTGGVADLVGRFFTQFFLYAWLGASVIAVMMMSIQLLTYRVMRMWCSKNTGNETVVYLFGFIPAILCVCFLTDENALMTVPVALLMVLGLALLLKTSKVVAVLAICVMVYILSTNHYYRTDDVSVLWAWASVWVLPLLIILSRINIRLKDIKPKTLNAVYLVSWLVLMTAGGMAVNSLQSQQKEEIMAYDFMARHSMWNRIIQKAQKRAPKNQVAVVALNLALAERGLLAEHLFKFPQNGIAGLLPNYNKDYISSLVTSEAFYQLGMINTAQRFVFESQEAIPDFQKSARCYKRLAETNLINGQYEVAMKYLNALSQTLYYRSWAIETLELLSDEAVETHPVYGHLRSLRCNENYFFGGNSPQQILANQLKANSDNRIAQQYFEAAMAFDRFK